MTLEAKANLNEVSSLLHWRKLKNGKFPALFCGVEGKDQREGDSPSFFNRHDEVINAII